MLLILCMDIVKRIKNKLLPCLENVATSICKLLALFVSHFHSNLLTGQATRALLVGAALGYSRISDSTPSAPVIPVMN